MGATSVGESSREGRGRARWALIVCGATIVMAIGGPLVGRGIFIGTSIVRSELPWNLETASSFEYRLPPLNDTVEIGAPERILIRDTLVNDHHVALWDPFANGGTPLGSQPNTGIFAPLSWPLLLLGVRLGSAWSGLLRLAVAASGTYFLLRRLGLSRFAAVCGGLAYCTSGFIVSWNNWPQADLAALLPLLFLATDGLRERRGVLDFVAVAALVGAMLLEGYPPLLIATFYALGGFLLVRWWESTRDEARGSLTLMARLRVGFRPAWLLAGAVVSGVALAAFQLLPFVIRLGTYDTSYRSSGADRQFPSSALLTAIFPWAQGNPAHRGTSIPYDHVTNFSITEQFVFLGAAAVVLVFLALLVGPPKRVTSGVYRYCAAVTGLLLLVLFGSRIGPLPSVGRWLRNAVYALPGMSEVPLHRLVAPLLFFAALLAAFGIEHVVSSDRATVAFGGRRLARAGLIAAFAGYLLVPALSSELHLTVSTTRNIYYGVPRTVAQRAYILTSTIVPLLIAIATVVAIVIALRFRGSARQVAIGVIPVLLAVEGLLVTTVMFPRVPDQDFYPETGVTRYLHDHLGHERIAPAGRMLYFGTNAVYGLRSVGGHSFTPPAWRELVNVAGSMGSDPTQLRLTGSLGLAQSPVLDRLGARYLVTSPSGAFGVPEPASGAVRDVVLGNGASRAGVVAPGPLRAVVLQVRGPNLLRGDLAFLDVTVRDPSGRIFARGQRRLISLARDTRYIVPVPGDRLPTGGPWTIQVALRSNRRDTARLAAKSNGVLSIGSVRPADDGLRLVYTDAGATVYRRLAALPRIRWASRTVTVPGGRARRNLLMTGDLPDDTVILDRPGPRASGRPARVVVKRDSGDEIRAEVNAKGAGYLVVADAIQDDWSVTVDGRPAKLRDADHAVVAVLVPAGRHVIELSATPRGWRTGIVVSLGAVLVLALVLAWGLLIRRRSRARSAATERPDVDAEDQDPSAKVFSK